MSPRAAARLDAMGILDVFDYVEGKMGWLSAGLPIEGRGAGTPRIVDFAVRDVPTCAISERIGDVQKRVRVESGAGCLVIDKSRIVLGVVESEGLQSDPDTPVESVMALGPPTVRARTDPREALEHMDSLGIDSLVVTTPEGNLLGVAMRCEIERRALS